MSDDKPFAEFFGIDGYRHIKIGGIVFPADGLTEGGIRQDSETLNRRVTARERKAAADAVMQLADEMEARQHLYRAPQTDAERAVFRETAEIVKMIRCRAQAIDTRSEWAYEAIARKAAAQALLDAADTVLDTHDGPAFRMIGSLDDGTENRRMFRDWLLRHSAKIERGEQ